MIKRITLAYHLEKRRERSGKLKQPQNNVFENIINAYLRNNTEISDVCLVPITLNYDKIYEGS
jgi:glycerol-3-phosphate O-acyltransferase